MAAGQLSPVTRFLRQVAANQVPAGITDQELLERFTRWGDEWAFAGLVRRHGPMVMGVCRRVLGDHHEVARSRRDVLVAARADVALPGLVGLDAPHLDLVVHRSHPKSAQATRAMQMTTAAATSR